MSTIRRLLTTIVHDECHPDRTQITPLPKELKRLRTTGKPFQWKLSETLVRSVFSPGSGDRLTVSEMTADAHRKTSPHERPTILSILENELAVKERHLQEILTQLRVKDHQIARQADIIEALNERLREGNILIGTLQRQLALGDGQGGSKTTSTFTVPPPAQSKKPPQHRKKDTVRKRSRFLRWLLG